MSVKRQVLVVHGLSTRTLSLASKSASELFIVLLD